MRGAPTTQFAFLPSDVSAATLEQLHGLRAHIDAQYVALGAQGPEDYQVELDRVGLRALLGRDAVDELDRVWCKDASAPYTRVVVRRCCARGKHINFHTDVSLRTLQVALNGDDEYDGGRLVFLNAAGAHAPPRRTGSITIHGHDIAHGVTELTGGTRYGLFFLKEDTPSIF